ncbi:porin family protein [Botryobacter ruber]|uniref:porin family protein n=1 Tax=Botryobacter ruber TaxID=2171629 RepID=UPI000E0B661E|nr:porin family protein [Botryobacter ruber]
MKVSKFCLVVLVTCLFFFPVLGSAQNKSGISPFSNRLDAETAVMPVAHQRNPTLKNQIQSARKLPVDFGLKFGINYANANFNKGFPKPSIPVESSWKPGFLAGLLVEVHVHDKFSLQQEYLFSQVGGEDKSLETAYKHRYASLPVMLKYKPIPKVRLTAGVQFDLLIKAEENIKGVQAVTTYDTEERSVGFNGGVEFLVSQHLSLNVRFMHGFNHIGIRQRSVRKEFKYEVAQLTADFRL